MKFSIGQVTIEFGQSGLMVIIPVPDYEISVNINYLPSSETPLDVHLLIVREPQGKPHA